MYKKAVKRLLDIFMAAIILIICSLFMLIIILLIKIESPGPAVFKQQRLGKNGRVFTMYKFRSMKQNSEHTGSGVYSE